MKPIKLEIEGLHSFESNQVIDFSLLSAKGIFGIFGATGSGKSTILDAIILALYGKVQRSKTNSDFINLKSKKAVINFEFAFVDEGKEKIYKIKRTFKRRPKNNQEVEQIAEVQEVSAIGSRQIVEGVSRVDEFVENLLGMGDTEFLKCIALPQGEFASFLKSKPNERVSIIGNIFDLNKYGQELWDKVKIRTDNLEREIAVVEGKMSVIGDIDHEKFEALKSEFESINREVSSKDEKIKSMKKIVAEEQEIARLGAELEEVQKNLNKYNEMTESVVVKKKALIKAKKICANKFTFDRYAEIMNAILNDEDELKKKSEALESARINNKEYFCNTILELEGLKSNTRKSIEKLERLKALKDVEARSVFLNTKLKELTTEMQIAINQVEKVQKKLVDRKTTKGIKQRELDEIDEKLSELKEKLKGYNSVLTYNCLNQHVNELKRYQAYTQEKYEEVVRSLTASISSQDKLENEKEEIVGQVKLLYKKYNIKGSLSEGKLIAGLNRAQEDYRLFSKMSGEIYTSLAIKKAKEREKRNLAEQLDRKELEKIRLDIKVQDFESDINQIKAEILRLKAVRDKALVDNGISKVIERLRIGDECPICNSEILQKSSFSSIDEMLVDNKILDANEVLDRKIAARDNCLYSIAKIVAEVENLKEDIEKLTYQISELEKTMCTKLDLVSGDMGVEVEKELEIREKTFSTTVENYVKSVNLEKQLYAKLRENEIALTKVISNNATTRIEMSVLSELLESLSSSVKAKDLELLGYVSSNEDAGEKLKRLEALNKELESNLEKRENVARAIMDLETEIAKLEFELATALNEKDEINKDIDNYRVEYKENAILLKSETIGGKVDYTIKLEEEELEGYKHRENEIITTREELKNVVHLLETEFNNMYALNKAHHEEFNNLKLNIEQILNELKLDDIEEARLFMIDESEIQLLENVVDNYEDNIKIAAVKKQELEKLLAGRISSPAIVEQMQAQINELEAEFKLLNEKQVGCKYEVNIMEEKILALNTLKNEYMKLSKEYAVHKELYELLKGKALLEFIAEEFIDDISFMASSKLQVLMDGRYVLKYDNKEFYVIDNFNDANVRPVATLSGGEIFVVSLALALAISDAIASKSKKNIDFFFLDEGFGTLDKDYCEYIIDSLIKLESQNITIGLISHIPELQDRISHKLEVIKTSNGSVVKIKHDI